MRARLVVLLAAAVFAAPSEGRASARPTNLRPQSQTPNDCTIVAVEMERAVRTMARMQKLDIWARVLLVKFADRKMGHALAVFQPNKRICVYDPPFGTAELQTTSRDPNVLARVIGRRMSQPIVSGRFLQ